MKRGGSNGKDFSSGWALMCALSREWYVETSSFGRCAASAAEISTRL